MSRLGIIVPDTGYHGGPGNFASYTVRPQDVVVNAPADPMDAMLWNILLTERGKKIVRWLTSQPAGFYISTLYNPRLTPQQKFEKILGVRINEMLSGTGNSGGGLLGDIFEWIGNLFSNQNLQNAESFIRRMQAQSQNIANMISAFRNNPGVNEQVNTQMQQQDYMIQKAFDVKSFIDKYGLYIIIGALGWYILRRK